MRISDWSSDVCSSDLPMVEKYGMMWAWYHPLCEAPNWELPYIPEIEDATGYTGSRRGSWTADTCIQEIAENGVDVAHLKFLHGAAGIPPVEASYDGPEIGRASCRERVCPYV